MQEVFLKQSMSLENLGGFVRELLINNDSLSDANNCRDSVVKIKSEINKSFPKAKVSFMAYPEVREGENVHYALLVDLEDSKMIVNAVGVPMFPMYIGDMKNAIPTFSQMKESDTVI